MTGKKSRSKKREEFVEKEKKSGLKPVYILGIVVVAIAAGAFFSGSGSSKAESIDTADSEGGNDPANLYIPISKVNDGLAHFYELPSKTGKTIRFFVLKSSDGIIRAAFDACDVCFREKKGYRQEGDNMVCNNCGRKFPSDRINVEQGGCNPAPLTRILEDSDHKSVPLNSNLVDGFVVINKSDIELGARYF
ncbi:MAG: DUF2318 domain-containing protein [Methanobacteriota archaeon]